MYVDVAVLSHLHNFIDRFDTSPKWPNWSKFEEAAAPRLKCQESKCTYHAFQQRPSPATLAMAGAAGHFDFLKKTEPKVQKMQGFIIDCLNIDTLH